MLAFYAEHFGSVEINNTFYRMPNEKRAPGLGGARCRRTSASC